MNPFIYDMEIKEKRREMLEEAGRQKLINLYHTDNPRKTDKFFLALAEFLINLGEKLKRRYDHTETLSRSLCRE